MSSSPTISLDLSHIEIVHRGTFGADGLLFSGGHALSQEGDALISEWSMPDVAMPPWIFWKYRPDQLSDQWIRMTWRAPATMLLEVGATEKGRPRTEGHAMLQAHVLTPETRQSTHYFWSTTRFSPEQSEEIDKFVFDRNVEAFDLQDKPLIQAPYENIGRGDFWDNQPIFLGVDAGATRARRMLQQMIASEAESRRG